MRMNPARQTTSGRAAGHQVAQGEVERPAVGVVGRADHGGVDPGPAGPFQPVGAGAVGDDQDDGHPRAGSAAASSSAWRFEPWPDTSTTTRLTSATASPVLDWFSARRMLPSGTRSGNRRAAR
jgi:hypothetical protein